MIKLILTKPENLNKNFIESIRKSGKDVIGVLCSKPYYLLKEQLKKVGANKKYLFLDTISPNTAEKNVFSMPGENLTALSIAINQSQQSFGGKVTILFDSITSLVIKNDPNTLIKFFSFIFSRVSDWKVDLVLIMPKEGVDGNLLSLITQSADKVVTK